MSPEKFMGWLEGFLEGCGEDGINTEGIKKIKEKMAKVIQQPNIIINPQKYDPFPYIPNVSYELGPVWCGKNSEEIEVNQAGALDEEAQRILHENRWELYD